MVVYRIGKRKYARDLSGLGAKLFGGRWNHEGTPCIYTAETRALSLLEYSVRINIEALPRAVKFTTIEFPNNLVYEIRRSELPNNWRDWPHPKVTRDFGNILLIENKHLVLKFPSALVPEEFIYVINPAHQSIDQVLIRKVTDFRVDARLRQ